MPRRDPLSLYRALWFLGRYDRAMVAERPADVPRQDELQSAASEAEVGALQQQIQEALSKSDYPRATFDEEVKSFAVGTDERNALIRKHALHLLAAGASKSSTDDQVMQAASILYGLNVLVLFDDVWRVRARSPLALSEAASFLRSQQSLDSLPLVYLLYDSAKKHYDVILLTGKCSQYRATLA